MPCQRLGEPSVHAAAGPDDTSAPPLSVTGITKTFGGLQVVEGMNLTVNRGELVGLIGPNGAGKTTLFNLIAGSLKPDAGRIAINGRDMTAAPAEARIGNGLGRTFQISRPFNEMTVLENVMTAVQHQTGESIFSNLFRRRQINAEEKTARAKAMELLTFLSIDRLADEPAKVMSGGQRKLLELARILITEPRVILLDEPAAGVNPALMDLIADRIVEINRSGVSILLIEHNMDLIARLCERVVVMAAGQELTQGTPDEIVANTDVVEAYLGDVV